jgi:hypothetical protein
MTPDRTPPVHAGRDFVRTDRLIVRIPVHGATSDRAVVRATLLDGRGTKLVELPALRTPDGQGVQLDLPLGSIAAGVFVLVVEATSGADRADAHVPFRVLR